MGLMTEMMMGVAIKSPREVGMKIAHATAYGNKKPEGYKDYDVFASRICYSPDRFYWWEEFRVVGTVEAFNSVHAMKVAKDSFPQYLRVAVMAANHPLSPTNRAKVKSTLQASIVLNRLAPPQQEKPRVRHYRKERNEDR